MSALRHPQKRLRVATAALWTLISSPATATLIFDNGPPDGTTNSYGGDTLVAYAVAEDFVLPTSAKLTGAQFWTVESETSVWDGTLIWYIFGDNGGKPKAAPIVSGAGVNVTKALTGRIPHIENVYSFSFLRPISVLGGKPYWFGLTLGSRYDQIVWETTSLGFGSGAWVSIDAKLDNWADSHAPLAFQLTGEPGPVHVPEPATWGMLVAALITAALAAVAGSGRLPA